MNINLQNKTLIGDKLIGLIFFLQIQTIKISEQNISNFYILNVSLSIKITKQIVKDKLLELDNEEMQNSETNLPIEPGITDFWTQNASYKKQIESARIVGMNNKELEKAINKNL